MIDITLRLAIKIFKQFLNKHTKLHIKDKLLALYKKIFFTKVWQFRIKYYE